MDPDLVKLLRGARHIAVLTGAGISAESGLPTFRQAQTGLWARYRPEDLATMRAFVRDPVLVWEWYAWRRQLAKDAEPNAGHRALARLQGRVPRLDLVTQNVDGLHQRAGSRGVVELHGNILRCRCNREGTRFESWDEEGEKPPRCTACGAHLRPDVVWFGESLPEDALEAAVASAEACDLFLCIGTSALVQPAASLPYAALRRGVPVIEVNPDETPLSRAATHVLKGAAGEALPAWVEAAWPVGLD